VLGARLDLSSGLNPSLNGAYTIYALGSQADPRDTPFYWIAEGVAEWKQAPVRGGRMTINALPRAKLADVGTLPGLLRVYGEKLKQGMDDMLPARVVAYDRATNRATV